VIEVKSGAGKGATTQVKNQGEIIGDGKEVMVYGPDLKPSVVKGLERSGVRVFKTLESLIEYIKSKGL
jgi:RIO-like serine/threonine protein kinase